MTPRAGDHPEAVAAVIAETALRCLGDAAFARRVIVESHHSDLVKALLADLGDVHQADCYAKGRAAAALAADALFDYVDARPGGFAAVAKPRLQALAADA